VGPSPKPPAATLSVEELVARARSGRRDSFDELVVRYRPRLVAFLARRLPDAGDAEDVAQETFLRAFDHLERYDPARPFATWLFTIGKNVAANHAVAARRRAVHEQAVADQASAAAPPAAQVPAAVASPGELDAPGDLWQRAAQVLRPDAYRMLWLRYAQGLSVQEVAAEMSRSAVAIKVMLFRARRRLLQEIR
jgi:RNA polymerase sigma-70 factor (ECF subfamily)